MKNARSITPTYIRIPPDLKLYLKGRAEKNHRSFNSEVLAIIESTKEKEEGEQQQ